MVVAMPIVFPMSLLGMARRGLLKHMTYGLLPWGFDTTTLKYIMQIKFLVGLSKNLIECLLKLYS